MVAAVKELDKMVNYIDSAMKNAAARERSIQIRRQIAAAPDHLPYGIQLERLMYYDEFAEVIRDGDNFNELQRVALYLFPDAVLVCSRQDQFRSFGQIRQVLDVYGSIMPMDDLSVMMLDGPPRVLRLHAGDTELLLNSSSLEVMFEWDQYLRDAIAIVKGKVAKTTVMSDTPSSQASSVTQRRSPFYPAPNKTHIPKRIDTKTSGKTRSKQFN